MQILSKPRQVLERCFIKPRKETPDLPRLNLFNKILLFVYDETKRGQRQASLLEEAEYVGSGFTTNPYSMYKKRLTHSTGYTPYLFIPTETEHRAKIQGELYYVSPKLLCELDEYQLHGELTRREKVYVRGRDKRKEKNEAGSSGLCCPFMYIMNRDNVNKENMEKGDLYKVESNEYYMFVEKFAE